MSSDSGLFCMLIQGNANERLSTYFLLLVCLFRDELFDCELTVLALAGICTEAVEGLVGSQRTGLMFQHTLHRRSFGCFVIVGCLCCGCGFVEAHVDQSNVNERGHALLLGLLTLELYYLGHIQLTVFALSILYLMSPAIARWAVFMFHYALEDVGLLIGIDVLGCLMDAQSSHFYKRRTPLLGLWTDGWIDR